MSQHLQLGQRGEKIAKAFLIEKGYNIVETNWHYQRMELDLIAKDQNTLVFVEVKTRSKDHHLPPEAAVDSRKEQRIVRAALAYMHHTNYEWAIRFDIIAIVEKGVDRYSIQHLEDAFFPS